MRLIRSRFTSAHAIALLALFVALGGSAYALHLGKNAVKTKNIKNAAVTEAKIAPGAVTATKLAAGAISPTSVGDVVVRSTVVQLADATSPAGTVKCHSDERLLGGMARLSATNVFDVNTSGPFPIHANGSLVEDGESVGLGGGIQAGFANPGGGTGPTTGLVYAICLK